MLFSLQAHSIVVFIRYQVKDDHISSQNPINIPSTAVELSAFKSLQNLLVDSFMMGSRKFLGKKHGIIWIE
jgi:hypothetical protein